MGTQSRPGFRLPRIFVDGGRVSKLVALVAFGAVALFLAVILLAGLGSLFGIGRTAQHDAAAQPLVRVRVRIGLALTLTLTLALAQTLTLTLTRLPRRERRRPQRRGGRLGRTK